MGDAFCFLGPPPRVSMDTRRSTCHRRDPPGTALMPTLWPRPGRNPVFRVLMLFSCLFFLSSSYYREIAYSRGKDFYLYKINNQILGGHFELNDGGLQC